MNIATTCCVTGHRPHKLGGYDESNPTMRHVIKSLEKSINFLIKQGYETFISGMAIGVDMVFAETVISFRNNFPNIKLISAIPFVGQDKMWNQNFRNRYNNILQLANEVVVVSDGAYSAHKMQIRNEWMVNRSSLVIAVWDGSRGGTGNCVQYAKSASHQPKILRITPQ